MGNPAKSSSNKSNNKETVTFSIGNFIAVVYVILMFTAFPFFLSNLYASARRDKFWLFVVLTSLMTVLMLIAIILDLTNVKFNSDFLKKRLSLNLTDIGILAFFIINVISSVIAVINGTSFSAVFLGSEGRNMGLLMIFMMVLCYFGVSRYYFSIKYVFYFIFFGTTIMSGIAILNYYYLDPLSIFKYYSDNQNVILNFTSTIGNKNYLSAMICVALPLSVGVAVSTDDLILKITSYFSVAVQFMGLLVATSDSGFLGCFVAFALMFIFLCRDFKKLSAFFACLSVMLVSSKVLWFFDLIMKMINVNNKGYTSFSEIFIFNHGLLILLPVFIALAVAFFFIKDIKGIVSKVLFIISIVVLIVSLVLVAGLLMYYNIINPEAEVNSITSFLRFNEDWGTHRGFFWINSFELFKDFNLLEKLFGTGPDTFKLAFKPYFSELLDKYGEGSVNAAHSVYINYLITTGILGLTAYLLFVVSSVADAFKLSLKNPLALAFLGVIVAYAFQDIVNIANPVNTPWFILAIAICQATRYRENDPAISKNII